MKKLLSGLVCGLVAFTLLFAPVMAYAKAASPPYGNALSPSVVGAASGSTGYVQFNTSGVLDGEANLTWDKTNDRLGIGSATPAVALDVVGAATVSGVIKTAGSTIVIGTLATPLAADACTAGAISVGSAFLYVCTASGAWKRVAITGGY